jgi:6-hydroxycyclohex-1-ene-1-carbonyl-CoA dehydrogenase
MKAAVLGLDSKLSIQDVPRPTPGPGEVLIMVAACGVCHTDLHYVEHGVPTAKKPPIILGHEASGIIVEKGSDVSQFAERDRVLIPAVLTCGHCRLCRTGRENICETMQMLGNHMDGAYAEYVKVPAKDLLRIPPEVSLQDASIIADALSTPFHAVRYRGEVRPGDTVAVFGCGGVGLNVIQFSRLAGAHVFAVDLNPRKLDMAIKMGADVVIDGSQVEQPDRQIRKESGGGVDVAFEVVGAPAAFKSAINSLRTGGRLVQVGYAYAEAAFPAGKVMFREIEIRGSLGCRPADYPLIIELVRTNKIDLGSLISHRFPLEEIGHAFELLNKGESIRSLIIPGERLN